MNPNCPFSPHTNTGTPQSSPNQTPFFMYTTPFSTQIAGESFTSILFRKKNIQMF
ncbi:hypothetical protein Hanom_Chr04g00314271 [Helianthus anomalus]